MPYDNVPEELWGKMDRCVAKVMAENPSYDKSRAIAICHSSVVKETTEQKGGAGSGHHGHAGRPGQVGGSSPGRGSGSKPKKKPRGMAEELGMTQEELEMEVEHAMDPDIEAELTPAGLASRYIAEEGQFRDVSAQVLVDAAGGKEGIIERLGKNADFEKVWDHLWDIYYEFSDQLEAEEIIEPDGTKLSDKIYNMGFEEKEHTTLPEQEYDFPALTDRPYGGAITFKEIQAYNEQAERENAKAQAQEEFRVIMDNILTDPRIPLPRKGTLIADLAMELPERVAQILSKDTNEEVAIEVPDDTFDRLLKFLKLKKEPEKTVDGKRLSEADFAHVPDGREPAGWKLPIHDAKHIALAITALQPGGFRGKTVELEVPKSRVISRIEKAINELEDDDIKEGLTAYLKELKGMKSSAFAVYKDVDGNPRWFGWVTNKWRDRDHVANPDKGGEILTDQAHKDYVGWVDEAPELRMPKLLAWHQLETAHKERADWMDYADGFLLASGPLTAKEAEAIERVEKTYDLGMSHGFIALSKDPNEGLIDSYRSFEVSFLPLEVAANPWTDFRTITKEVFAMGLTENKRGFLRNLMGDEFVEEVEQENSDKATTLEEAGVDFKEGEEDELVESGEIDLEGEAEAAEEEPEEEKAQMESDKDEDEDEEEEEEKELEPAPDPVAELRDEMKDALVAVGEVLFEIKEEIAGMKQSREEVDEKIEKAIEESPAASLRDMFQKSAIGAEEARVDGRTSEAKDGPEETDPNPKKEGFGIPVLEAIKQANLRHYEQ